MTLLYAGLAGFTMKEDKEGPDPALMEAAFQRAMKGEGKLNLSQDVSRWGPCLMHWDCPV
jgi:hypothetical protein